MSNASLKEQLEALSLTASPSTIDKRAKKTKKRSLSSTAIDKNTKQKPAWLEQAQYGVELLKAYFPACFKDQKEIQPLKVGIKQDLVKHLSTLDNIVIGDKACMVNSLAYYVNSVAYHKNVVVGATRIDLQGQPAGVVSAEEANYSLEYRQTKLQKRKSISVSSHPSTVESSEN